MLSCITVAIAVKGFPTSRHVIYWVSQLHWKGSADCVAGRGGHIRHPATATHIFPVISGIPPLYSRAVIHLMAKRVCY